MRRQEFLAVALTGFLVSVSCVSASDSPRNAAEPVRAGRTEVAPGLIVERVPASEPSPAQIGNGLITLVRIDPRKFELRLLTDDVHGSRTAPRWVEDFDLTGVINASMFRGSDEKSTGLMVDGDQINNNSVNAAFGAFLAFGPRAPSLAPVQLFGRSCPGFDLARIRKDYRAVVQNYRMLGCDSGPIAWKDPKVYSIAAVGVDQDGWVVFIHSRTPYRMREFNAMIVSLNLGIQAAMFVEGGPEASLYVKTDREVVREVGSYETGFFENDANTVFWPVPNVIGFSPIDSGRAVDAQRDAPSSSAAVINGRIDRDDETKKAIRNSRDVGLPLDSADNLELVVTKSRYRLDVALKGKILKTFPIALGSSPEKHKEREGDMRTPEGRYDLIPHHNSPSFGTCFYIRYPNEKDAEEALADGRIGQTSYRRILDNLKGGARPPENTGLGGLILLHGNPDPLDYQTSKNWTYGCIAMENEHLRELLDLYSADDRPVLEIRP